MSAAQVAAAESGAFRVACGLDEETVQAVLESARAVVEAVQAEAPQAAEAEPGTESNALAEVGVGHCSDLQDRGVARHLEP